MSGAFASYGKYADMGSRLAIAEHPQLLGHPLKYKVIDTEGNAGKAVRKVQEAIGQDGARFFQGAPCRLRHWRCPRKSTKPAACS